MKNKSLYIFLLTALVAAGACVTQARAYNLITSGSAPTYNNSSSLPIGPSPEHPIYNATQVLSGIPDSDHETVNCDSTVSLTKEGRSTIYAFAMCLDLYNNFGDLSSALPPPVYLKLTNAAVIDSSILAYVDSFGNYTDFLPKSVGPVTLTYEGDIVVNGTTRHIIVDQIVTVTE